MTRGKTIHGHARDSGWSPEYSAWVNMIARCTNPRQPCYPRYGGRGITVCERWRNSFEAFFADMGPRTSNKHTLERNNNDAGYAPDNCEWATRAKQARNRSSTRFIEFGGECLCVADMAVKHGLNPLTLRARLRLGWSVERALTSPVQGKAAT